MPVWTKARPYVLWVGTCAAMLLVIALTDHPQTVIWFLAAGWSFLIPVAQLCWRRKPQLGYLLIGLVYLWIGWPKSPRNLGPDPLPPALERSGGDVLAALRQVTSEVGGEMETDAEGHVVRLVLHNQHSTDRTTVGDSVLLQSPQLTHLRHLDLEGSRVGDVGASHLRKLTRLEFLDLSGTNVSDWGLSRLATLTKLNHLDIGYCKRVTDAGLGHVEKLQALRFLGLSGVRITDAGLERLRGLPGLQTLFLRSTGVTDSGMAIVGEMKSLRSLDLRKLPITDAGLRHLRELKQLNHLDLRGTRVSGAGVAELRGALPGCRIGSR